MTAQTTITPIACPAGHLVAYMDSTGRLVAGCSVFEKTVTMRCLVCGWRKVWTPGGGQ